MEASTRLRTVDYQKDFDRTIAKLKGRDDVSERNKEMIIRFCNDCLEGRTVVEKRKKRVSLGAVRKYLFGAIIICKHIGKDLDSLDKDDKQSKDIHDFVRGLDNGIILNNKGRQYTSKTRADIKITLRKLFKWLYGENVTYPNCVLYVDTSHTEQEIPAISRDEVFFWANRESTLRRKALILFLFDSGARAEELLNVRMKHVLYDKDEKSYRIRIEHSKTTPRTIFVPIATEILREYIDSYSDRHNSDAQLFPITYNGMRKFIGESSGKYLDKHITPHGLRHSSATYYCEKLTPYQLCHRYGWSMSSDMPQRYIDRQGLTDKESSKAVRFEQQDQLKDENRRLKEELVIMKNQLIGEMEESTSKLRAEFTSMFKEQIKKNQLRGL